MSIWNYCRSGACLKALHSFAVAVASALVLVLATPPAYANHPGGPTTTLNVQPIFVSGNPTCSSLGSEFIEYKINDVGNGTFTAPDGTKFTLTVYSTAQGQAFDWTVTGGVVKDMVVKGGPDANHYIYDPPHANAVADTFLHSPVNHNNNRFYGLSHISFCYEPGAPDIEITKTCDSGTLVGSLATYNYTATIKNTGSVPLTNVEVMESGAFDSCVIVGPSTSLLEGFVEIAANLAVNETIQLSIQCTAGSAGLENHIMVRAKHESSVVEDDDKALCEFISQPSVSVDKFCPLTEDGALESVRLKAKNNKLVVEVCPEIIVKNNGPEDLQTVVVVDPSIPALAGGVNLTALLGGNMVPNQTVSLGDHLDLCYYPSVPETVVGGEFDGLVVEVDSIDGLSDRYATASATFFNMVSVAATSVFGGLAEADDSTFHWDPAKGESGEWVAECPLCLPCPDCEKEEY